MDPEQEYFIEHSPEYYRRVAVKAEDEVLVRLCLLLAATELAQLRAELGDRAQQRALPTG